MPRWAVGCYVAILAARLSAEDVSTCLRRRRGEPLASSGNAAAPLP
jgi:hypothetical protein